MGAGVELARYGAAVWAELEDRGWDRKAAVGYGLRNRKRPPVHVIGIDDVSRRKGQVYLTVVYDLERRVLLWVGEDRTEEAVTRFFTVEMGRRDMMTKQNPARLLGLK